MIENEDIQPMQTAVRAHDSTSRASDFAIGLFSLVAMLCFAGAWMWLKSVPFWNPPQKLSVYFHDVAGLNQNAAVYADGVRIGSVEDIVLKAKRTVLVKLRINTDNVKIPVGSSFDILTNGVVGARFVDVVLPEDTNGKLMTPDMVVWGKDPVRTEVLLDKIASNLSSIDFKGMEQKVDRSLEQVTLAAGDMSVLSRRLRPAADRAAALEDRLSLLTGDLRNTNAHIVRMLKDPTIKNELRTTLSQLNETTAHVENSVIKLEALANNPEVRADLKQTVSEARDTVTQVHAMLADPKFGADVKGTMARANSALARMDTVGQQLSQMLSRRAPLLQMLFGRPGALHLQQQAAGTVECTPE